MSSLENLKVGDEVLVYGGSFSQSERIEIITRKTAKQTVAGNYRFWTKNGNQVGGSTWSNSYARPATLDDKQRIIENDTRRKAIARIKKADLKRLSTGQLIEMDAILLEDRQ